jgi:hypothetical protein
MEGKGYSPLKGTGGKPHLMVEPVKSKDFFSLKTKREERRERVSY